MEFPIEISLLKDAFEQAAPLTLLLLLAFLVMQHSIKSLIEAKLGQVQSRKTQEFATEMEHIRYRNQRSAIGYEIWLNRIFDTNTQLFTTLSEAIRAMTVLDRESASFQDMERNEIQQHVRTSYGENEDIDEIMGFWHSNRSRTLDNLDAYLLPVRLERIRQTVRVLEDLLTSKQLFISPTVVKLIREVLEICRSAARSTDAPPQAGSTEVRLAQLQTKIHREIVNTLSEGRLFGVEEIQSPEKLVNRKIALASLFPGKRYLWQKAGTDASSGVKN